MSELIAAMTKGLADVTAAVTAQSGADLAPLTAQVERVADSLNVVDTTTMLERSIAQVAEAANAQIASVIGADTAGDNRVRVDPLSP